MHSARCTRPDALCPMHELSGVARSSPMRQVGPAFAEIAVTWETEFQFACLEELVKRVGSHLGRLGGGTVDVEAAKLTLHKAEDAVVANATKVQPTE
eukprot:6949285-Prymnesium_polylepis.1